MKDEILKLLSGEKKNVIDSITVLPDERLGAKTWGIITVSVANMRSDPGEDAELSSQVLMGSVVKILKKKGDGSTSEPRTSISGGPIPINWCG